MKLRLLNILDTAIIPALSLLPRHLDTPKARVLLLAIGLQESRFQHRVQIIDGGGKGPARGFWQFERGGGVAGVYRHRASAELLRQLCRDRDVSLDTRAIWAQLEHDDVLAAGVARLLLLTDPAPLPEIGEQQKAWDYYERNWRPGKPHPHTWPALYASAVDAITGDD